MLTNLIATGIGKVSAVLTIAHIFRAKSNFSQKKMTREELYIPVESSVVTLLLKDDEILGHAAVYSPVRAFCIIPPLLIQSQLPESPAAGTSTLQSRCASPLVLELWTSCKLTCRLVHMALGWRWCRFRFIHNTFRRSMETISRYFKQVLFAVGELRGEMIKRPSGQTPPKIRGSPRWYPYSKDCIGAIDGTHVIARVPR
ncbi:unnamed protein product [Triticum turgidum subsp. durum]|uniref:DDE Tnp4 domain-containing protein n=1 Tax=Triticum turgidum subsp. durum TaxID=4567 RepID=A0A9R1Q1Y8_TRITD|nr:unnamed protein product [Triticum turgidum subsp. durum]